MAPGILSRLRRRPSASLPLRSQPPQSYVHHASMPPEWPISPAQATPDVYITSPPEEDGLLMSVCVHRAVEHEPKRLRKREDRNSLPLPVSSASALMYGSDGPPVEGPPAFRRSSLQAPEVVFPKKPSEIVRESAAMWKALNRQPVADKNASNPDEFPAETQAGNAQTAARVQWDSNQPLAHVSAGREATDGQPVLKPKDTLRHRASKVLKTFTNRESLRFGSSTADKRNSQPDVRTNGSYLQNRRNTLSDSSRSAFNMLAQAATAHAIPSESNPGAQPPTPPATRTSGEGRRRSSTLTHVEFTPRPVSPPLPPLPTSQGAVVEDVPAASPVPSAVIIPLEPAAEIVEAAQPLPEQSSPKSEKFRLQPRRSKNTFSHLFNLKGEKLRSPPPAKPAKEAVPPVPVIPQELAKALTDPDTPEVSQSSTFASPTSTAATPKSSKRKRFKRHRRRATVSSVSHVSTNVTGAPSSMSTMPQAETPTSPRSRPFMIVDLRKGFSVRGLGKSKGKLFSARSSPSLGSPPPMPTFPATSESHELPETVMQRYKSRPPPLQSTNSPYPSEGSPAPVNENNSASPITVEFEPHGTALPSPTDSDGPGTPMVGAHEGSTPALSMGLTLAPAIELDEPKTPQKVLEFSFTPLTSEESNQVAQRPSTASEVTLLSEDPLFGSLNSPTSIGNLDLQLREPSTKTSTLDAHVRLDSLRFDNFSFDTHGF